MGEKSLENDLKYYIINFKQVVQLTDLILDYKIPYNEVERLVESHLATAGKKFEKQYLIHGFEKTSKNEIFTIVPENELKSTLNKLENVKSNLFSVELCGGSKSVAQPLKPLTYATIALKNATKDVVENKASQEVKAEQSSVQKKTETKVEDKKVTEKKKISPLAKKPSPEEKKAVKKPLAEKGQIRKPSPKKLNDFFKKNTTKPTTTTTQAKAIEANESMQLFDEEEVEDMEALEAAEKQDKLRRELVENELDDNDDDNDVVNTKTNATKRRRILDSDDEEEQPEAKQDKKVERKQQKEEEIEPGTYLDEEGFVLTVKPKKQTTTPQRTSPRKSLAKQSPIKNSPKKSAPQKKAAPKTKQGSIMSFFGKK